MVWHKAKQKIWKVSMLVPFFFFLALLPHAIKDGKGFNQINNREVLINIVTKKKVTISQLHNSKCRIENTTQEQVK